MKTTKIRAALRRRNERRQFQIALDAASPSMRQELIAMSGRNFSR